MLYVSTRNSADTYTAYRALHEDRTPDGGLYVPHRLPVLPCEERKELSKKTLGERIARILNIFFPVALNRLDVDFIVGRHPFKLVTMNHKLYIAELWHNVNQEFGFIESALYNRLCESAGKSCVPTNWAKIAIRISVLAAICFELQTRGVEQVDIACISGDYAFVMAAWYARKMGLPISKIICTSDENGSAWDLFQRGEFSQINTRADISLPLLDFSCPPSLEVLIYENFGVNGVEDYLMACDKGAVCHFNEELFTEFTQTMEGAVVSRARYPSLIKSICRTHDYICDPYLAISYGGLQDFRSRTGESRTTLLLSEVSPALFQYDV